MRIVRDWSLSIQLVVFCLFGSLVAAAVTDRQAGTGEPTRSAALPAPPAGLSALEIGNLLDARDIFYDADGLIIHREGGRPDGKEDGGDTSQREGWYWFGVWIRQNTPGLQRWTPPRKLTFKQVVQLLEPNRDGVFRRHPKDPRFNNPYDKAFGYSRDQMVPMVAAMGVWGMRDEVRRMWNALPEDLLGKHAFNGNWRNFLGQDGRNCTDIKKRGCDATQDCSLKRDDRTCPLKVDSRPCDMQVDDRDCSLKVDSRSCGISTPFGQVNDPICEAAKAAQNAIYQADKAACEVAKGSQNGIYKANKDACEAGKASQNVIYKGEKDACEGAKASQNLAYKAEHDACEAAKTASKATCEANKAADQALCLLSNVHSGDPIGPMTVNLFRRAMGENPISPASSLTLPPVNVGGGLLGETELMVNARLRVAMAETDKGDTGDDLNLIVMLLMARVRFPTNLSDGALKIYADNRPHSYGSYLGAYRQKFGDDATDIEQRIIAGIASGWQPDASPQLGAVRWYHRPDTGANPLLAELYEPILGRFVK